MSTPVFSPPQIHRAIVSPVIRSFAETHPQWLAAREAFRAMFPSLLQTHKGKFVAIHEGRIVVSADDLASAALASDRILNGECAYIDQVLERSTPPSRVAGPRDPASEESP